MTDKYRLLIQKLVNACNERADIRCIIAIGSQCRRLCPADEYSDLDLIIGCDAPDLLLYGDAWLGDLGEITYSFVERTIFDQKERRVLFDDDRDVDFIIIKTEVLVGALVSGQLDSILCRGCEVLYDRAGLSKRVEAIPRTESPACAAMSDAEFDNIANDFYFHVVWTRKKLARGEIWTAKMCLDSYMKQLLLTMIELHEDSPWHSGRMLESWAEPGILEALRSCFAHYDKADIARALENTETLFTRLARDCARRYGFGCDIDALRPRC